MKVTTIKQYENTYTFAFGYNGKQFGESEETIDKNTNKSHHWDAYREFVKDTNRYRSIPTPDYDDCTFSIERKSFTKEESGYRVYTVTIRVTWQYIKE